jgi:signal transduction histidine kinase
MNLIVQSARMLVAKDLSQVGEQLDRLEELARSAVDEIQVLISQLRPKPLTSQSLSDALRELIHQRQVQDSLQVDMQILGDRELPQTTILGLYRIVQEALNNIVKHAATNQALIRYDLQSRPAYLEVIDHGSGFNPHNVPLDATHLGLAGMAGRAKELGWIFQIDSHPGQGTRIRLEETGE